MLIYYYTSIYVNAKKAKIYHLSQRKIAISL